jgi:hypothetical protein
MEPEDTVEALRMEIERLRKRLVTVVAEKHEWKNRCEELLRNVNQNRDQTLKSEAVFDSVATELRDLLAIDFTSSEFAASDYTTGEFVRKGNSLLSFVRRMQGFLGIIQLVFPFDAISPQALTMHEPATFEPPTVQKNSENF